MTEYLTVTEALAIHSTLIELFGGADGIRDMGLLESALYRPQTGYYADLIEEAAAVWESLSQNHPFIDGNKRTAFAAMHAFLALNGIQLTASSAKAEKFISGLYESHCFVFGKLADWLRANTK